MSELERIHAFLDENDRATATRVVPFPWGIALLHDRLPLVYDLNFLYVEHGEPTAEQLAAEAERIHRAAGHEHRAVCVSEPDVERLTPGFDALGWSLERLVAMAAHREPDREPEHRVDEVGIHDLLPMWAASIRSEEFTSGREDVVEQLLEHKRVVAAAVPTRYFAARAGGEIASNCELYERDGVAQIESVTTAAPHRNQGLASAVVIHALAESRSSADLTFLVADRDDFPRALYGKLGFDDVGGYAKFTLRPS